MTEDVVKAIFDVLFDVGIAALFSNIYITININVTKKDE